MPARTIVVPSIHLCAHTFKLNSRLCNTWVSMHFCFPITVVVAILTYCSFSLGVCPPLPPVFRGVSFSHTINDACVMSIQDLTRLGGFHTAALLPVCASVIFYDLVKSRLRWVFNPVFTIRPLYVERRPLLWSICA